MTVTVPIIETMLTEREFCARWIATLWQAMTITGNGYHRPTLKRRPPKGASHWRGERRPDKVEAEKLHAAVPVVTGKINFRRSERV